MTKRSPGMVLVLTIVTLGIYGIVWMVKTKNEMVSAGADIPTAWLIIIPIANLYWMWKFSAGVEHVTGGKMSGVMAFIGLLLLNQFFFIGTLWIQSELNKAIDRGAPGQLPMARVA